MPHRRPSLRELQLQVRDMVQGGDVRVDYLNHAERLEAYVDGYPTRLFEALSENFEATYHFCGHELFLKLSLQFIENHPSIHYNLSNYDLNFIAFVEKHSDCQHIPFLGDLARYDWVFSRTFHARAEPVLVKDKLSSLSESQWEKVLFHFQPYLNLLESRWPINKIWDACMHGKQDEIKDVQPQPSFLVLFRRGDDLFHRPMDPQEYLAIKLFQEHKTLGEVCEILAGTEGQQVPIGEWMQIWMAESWICDANVKLI